MDGPDFGLRAVQLPPDRPDWRGYECGRGGEERNGALLAMLLRNLSSWPNMEPGLMMVASL